MKGRLLCSAALMALAPGSAVAYDWPQFCGNAQHTCWNTVESELTAANVKGLKKIFEAVLPAATDAQPAFLGYIATGKGNKDLVFINSVYGHLSALDAYSGETVWTKQLGDGHFQQSGPAVDPDRRYVYGIGRDGFAHKLKVGDGSEVTGGGWPAQVSANSGRKPASLSVATAKSGAAYLYACTSGGGAPLVGTCTAVNLADGSRHVFNAVCSKKDGFLAGGCGDAGGNAWSRAGVVYHPDLDRIFFTTGDNEGNGFNPGADNWSHSLVALRPDASTDNGVPLDSYTDAPTGHSNDLASTGPALIPSLPGCKYKYLALQGAKDRKLRFVNLEDMSGKGKPGGLNGAIGPILGTPQTGIPYSQPAIWKNPADGTVWAFVGTEQGICGLQIKVDAAGLPMMDFKWSYKTNFTNTAIVANGVLYFCDGGGQVKFWNGNHNIYACEPTTGAVLWKDVVDFHHWSSPMVANGVLYVPDGTVSESGGSGKATLKAFALRTDKQPDPTAAPATQRLRGLTLSTRAGFLRVDLTLPAPARLWLSAPDGKSLLDADLEGASAHEIILPPAARGVSILRLRQGGEETRAVLYLE
jgi:outer membrane protein assembly factor BamB